MRKPEPKQVQEAEKKVAAVLEELEKETRADVQRIALEDVVDTDSTGRPQVLKSVDITVTPRPQRHWSR